MNKDNKNQSVEEIMDDISSLLKKLTKHLGNEVNLPIARFEICINENSLNLTGKLNPSGIGLLEELGVKQEEFEEIVLKARPVLWNAIEEIGKLINQRNNEDKQNA